MPGMAPLLHIVLVSGCFCPELGEWYHSPCEILTLLYQCMASHPTWKWLKRPSFWMKTWKGISLVSCERASVWRNPSLYSYQAQTWRSQCQEGNFSVPLSDVQEGLMDQSWAKVSHHDLFGISKPYTYGTNRLSLGRINKCCTMRGWGFPQGHRGS